MLKPMTEKEKELTFKNIVAAVKDIEKLNRRGYHYLYIMSGFIAHYNLYGFIDYYREHSLRDDIVRSIKDYNYQNFDSSDRDWLYYVEKIDLNKKLYSALQKPIYNNIPLKACFCDKCGQRIS